MFPAYQFAFWCKDSDGCDIHFVLINVLKYKLELWTLGRKEQLVLQNTANIVNAKQSACWNSDKT
jgi:hypothetical protein